MSYLIIMDNLSLQIIRELVNARNQFFRRPYLFRNQREEIARQFLETESEYLGVISRITDSRRNPITITIPMNLSDFSEPVPVLPSAAQIANEVENHTPMIAQNCSICQDQIVSDGARLRACQHVYHRACIQTWFGASARCPICRRDIREDSEAQTSAVSTEMSTQ